MRTDRGWRRFYGYGWLVSGVVGVLSFVQWHMHVREVEKRAEDAERTRDEVARRRAVEERLRIARELHDSLTHSISVIKVQAGVATHLARKNGEEPSAALLAIEEASTDAARELRSTLDVLRREDDANGSGLDRLPGLVERARSSGLPTRLTVRGAERPLPAEVDQAAYRVVQEALTNVTRHAGDATASVQITYDPDCLTVRVEDDGDGAGQPPVPGLRADRDARAGHRSRWAAARGARHRRRLLGGRGAAGDGVAVIRVVLVDDQPLIRTGIRALLDAEDDIEVVAEGGNGLEGVELAVEHLPDIVLMDVQMPVMDGIEATRRIVDDDRLADVQVVILTNYGLDDHVFNALRAGASGFVLKDTEPADLLQALRVTVRGEALLSPGVTRRLISEFATRPATALSSADPDVLTNREREVVALVAHGLSNDEIAERMVLSPMTAKTHVSRAMTKLGARDRAQLVVFAYQSGLVEPGSG